MAKNVPEDTEQFNKLMSEVDKDLANKGLAIHQRPLNALSVVSAKFDISLPMSQPRQGMPEELLRNWPVSQRIRKWYDDNYGDRQKIHLGPGCMAVLINQDVWVFRFPRIYGSVKLIVSRTIKSEKIRSDGKPVAYNILDCVENMPPGFRMSLNNTQLSALLKDFVLGFNAIMSLESIRGNNLIELALSDISASINHMLAQKPEYGLSKWSSLQAAEKIIKAAIKRAGGNYTLTHKLDELITQALKFGLKFEVKSIIDRIQCSPAIRYDEEPCSKISAAQAHYAVFELANIIFPGRFANPI